MLYGMEEFDDEFGLIKSEKLNIKKVSIVIAILCAVFAVIFLFFIFTKKEDTTQEQYSQTNYENNDQKVTEDTVSGDEESVDVIENIPSQNDKVDGQYDGKHMQIASHDMSKIETRFLPVANENAQREIKDIYFSDEKQVYLTFDDGPSKDITPQILDILKENGVKATFFVLGARVELYPETLKREFYEGHYIANHGYSHKYSRIYESRDMVFDEFRQTEECIKNALENQDYNSFLFRFPGGSSGGTYEKVKSEAREMFKEYGIAYTNWNCLTGDAAGKRTKEECLEEMINTKGNQNSIILLMHDANDKSQTVEALPEVIQYYKNEGYTFKTFYDIFK